MQITNYIMHILSNMFWMPVIQLEWGKTKVVTVAERNHPFPPFTEILKNAMIRTSPFKNESEKVHYTETHISSLIEHSVSAVIHYNSTQKIVYIPSFIRGLSSNECVPLIFKSDFLLTWTTKLHKNQWGIRFVTSPWENYCNHVCFIYTGATPYYYLYGCYYNFVVLVCFVTLSLLY